MEGGGSGGRAAAVATTRMSTVSRHYFGGSASEYHHDLRVDIIENIEEDYGMFVWPCSVILAEYVWQQRSRFSASRVVELGAGTSLPGLVVAKVGADVTLSPFGTAPGAPASLLSRYCSKELAEPGIGASPAPALASSFFVSGIKTALAIVSLQ